MPIIALIFVAALSRLIPHPANMTAVVAIALYGASRLPDKVQALFIPVAAMLLSDLALEAFYVAGFSPFHGLHSGMWYVYLAFTAVTLVGFLLRQYLPKEKLIITPIAFATIGSSLLFFIMTNFGVWLGSGFYPQTISGLMLCYDAALPFLRNQLAGDLFFVMVIFGADYVIKKSVGTPVHVVMR